MKVRKRRITIFLGLMALAAGAIVTLLAIDFRTPEQLYKDFLKIEIPAGAFDISSRKVGEETMIQFSLPAAKFIEFTSHQVPGCNPWRKKLSTEFLSEYPGLRPDDPTTLIAEHPDDGDAVWELVADMQGKRIYARYADTGW